MHTPSMHNLFWVPSINWQPLKMPVLTHFSSLLRYRRSLLNDGTGNEGIFKYMKPHSHQHHHTNLWRVASDGEHSPDWTSGTPVALNTAECKFLLTNKQPVVRGGWSSWRARVLGCVCAWRAWKKGEIVGFVAGKVKRPPRLCKLFRLSPPPPARSSMFTVSSA